jgi:hypothetical protein
MCAGVRGALAGATMLKCPGWAEFWNVDEVIECIPGMTDEHIAALMAACPDAYEDDNHDEDGEVFIEDPRDYATTKADRGRCLQTFWGKLPLATQQAILKGYAKDHGEEEE